MQSQRMSQSPWACLLVTPQTRGGKLGADGLVGNSSVSASIHSSGESGAGENQAVLFEALHIIHWPKPAEWKLSIEVKEMDSPA